MAVLNSTRANAFLRAFWSTRHGKPLGAKLFTAFKKTYQPPTLYDLSVEMRRDAERYAALFSSADPTWSQYGDKVRRSVDALGIMGVSQAYPMILAGLERFNRTEMGRLMWLIECVGVRHQLIGGKLPGRVESLGGRAAKEIYDGKITAATGVYVAIKELYVSDDEFKLAFEKHEEGSGKKIRYLIAGIEREIVARDQGLLNDETIPHSVTVEHILPQKPSEGWISSVGKDHLADGHLISRLGNMCLLPGINGALGNKDFAVKVETYKKSSLKTTNSLGQYQNWGKPEIHKRQEYMAQLAVSAWRFQ